MSNPHPQVPELDLVATAKTTRKTLERLIPFSHARSASEPLPLLTKIIGKISSMIKLIDSSMLNAQLGYHIATDAMIMCDREEADWETDISLDYLRELSARGEKSSREVADGFREISQEVYKIAASTKDNDFVVLVPPDPTHSGTLKIHLKDIGSDLVASLNLLLHFSREVSAMAEWWTYINANLASGEPTLLSATTKRSSEEPSTSNVSSFAWWSHTKESFQDYYNIIHVVHVRFPQLLSASKDAWQSTASARSVSPTSIGHFNDADQTEPGALAIPAEEILANPGKESGMHALASRFGLSRRNRKVTRESRTSTVSHGSGNTTVVANDQSASEDKEHDGLGKPKKKSIFSSCFSGSLFEDGVVFLGCHGMK